MDRMAEDRSNEGMVSKELALIGEIVNEFREYQEALQARLGSALAPANPMSEAVQASNENASDLVKRLREIQHEMRSVLEDLKDTLERIQL